MVAFKARRGEPELLAPARPTPRETKSLSDVDCFPFHWAYIPFLLFFQSSSYDDCHPTPADPAMAIKAAIAKALVYFFPVAGRMREAAEGKLVIDCTDEGIYFVEADADVRLEDFGQMLLPPYPCVEELLCDVGNIFCVVGKPIVFTQVTRFKCGGFAIGLHISHCIADGFGMALFIKTIVDLARGEAFPILLPVWERDILSARLPPNSTDAYKKLQPFLQDSCNTTGCNMHLTPPEDMAYQNFLFGPKEIAKLRSHIPEHLGPFSTFEILSAWIWRCRSVAFGYDGRQKVCMVYPLDIRRMSKPNLRIPVGYYGNAYINDIVAVTVDELCNSTIGHVLQLIRKAKLGITEEYIKSALDMMATFRGSSLFTLNKAYVVTDMTRVGLNGLDMGWAKSVGGGTAILSNTSSYMRCKNENDEETIAASMLLPSLVMERFEKEIAIWLKNDVKKIIPSTL